MSTYGYLVHHGVKGQKWGVRRYQNEDGSLTEAGKKRYNQDSDYAAKALYDTYLAKTNADDKNKKSRQKWEQMIQEAKKQKGKGILKTTKPASYKDFMKTHEAKDSRAANIAYGKAIDNQTSIKSDLAKKYSNIEMSMNNPLIDKKTGKKYVRAALTDKFGKTYISEFYV